MQVDGHPFVLPDLPKYKSKEEAEKVIEPAVAQIAKVHEDPGELPEGSVQVMGLPTTIGAGATGRNRIWQYTNAGAPDEPHACGQAAIATVLTGYGLRPEDPGAGVVSGLWKDGLGPDVPGDGTSMWRMESAFHRNGLKWTWVTGVDELKKWISQNYLAVLLLEVGFIPEEGWPEGWLQLHWTVAFAYDDAGLYITNWPNDNRCGWGSLEKAWSTGFIKNALGKAHQFLLVYQP